MRTVSRMPPTALGLLSIVVLSAACEPPRLSRPPVSTHPAPQAAVSTRAPTAAVTMTSAAQFDPGAFPTWNQVGLASAPVSGIGDVAAFDLDRGVTVYFAGNFFGCGGSEGNDTWELSGTTWTQRTQLGANGPSTRLSPGLAYDAARHVTVLFGGSALNDTWTWDGTAWAQASLVHNPPARSLPSLAYDSVRRVSVLFGGYDINYNILTDTWEWDGTDWTQRSPATVPSTQGPVDGIFGAATPMFYDSVRQVTTLYTGSALYTWDGANWTLLSPATTPPAGGAMVFDTSRGVAVMFGGESGTDTWEWNGSTWTQLSPWNTPTDTGLLAFDAVHDVTVMLAGTDLWTWDGTEWTQTVGYGATIPTQRSWHAMAFDSGRGVSVLFGGELDAPMSDTWEFDGTAWTMRTPATPVYWVAAPSPRVLHAMAYDSRRGVTVLFGGCADVTGNCVTPLNDTWEWDGKSWTQRTPALSPPGREGHAMAYDSVRGVTVLFGGMTGSGNLHDTWEWNGTSWTQLSPKSNPGARNFHAMAFDSTRAVTVLFGGVVTSDPVGDTWEWDGAAWTQLNPANAPAARVEPTLAYDSTRHVTVLYGGSAVEFGPDYDTWAWDGSAWTQLAPLNNAGVRSQQAMVYDSWRGVTTLFGGTDGFGELGDTWVLQQG